MPIQPSKYKDVHMYSSFPYIREVGKGVISANKDVYPSYFIDTSVAMPSGVKSFPAYVRAYVESPTGVFHPVQGMDGLSVGWTDSRIYFFGFYNLYGYDQLFRIHYFVYDRITV